MRKNDLVLIIVLIVAVIGSGLLARTLHKQQAELAPSREYVHRMPLAGFQKFMADVVWMRFLYYAGGNQLTAETAPKYENFIRLIIKLDPDFFRAYRDGALMLGPVAPDKALEIVDLAAEHPRMRNRWELPMMAGQIIMRKQWQGHYAGKEIDPQEVARARTYFQQAKSLPGHRPTAVSSFIRTNALMSDNELPREINELLEWRDYWRTTRFDYDMDAMMPTPGGGMASGSNGPASTATVAYSSFDVDQRIINQIKKVAKRYVQKSDVKPELRQRAEEIIQETIDQVFPNERFDAESYIPYQVNASRRYVGTIENPQAKKYVLELDAPEAYAVGLLTVKARQGTAKLTVLINGEPVNGLDNLTVGQEKATWPKMVEIKSEAMTEDDDADPDMPEDMGLPQPEVKAQPRLVRLPLRDNKGEEGSIIELVFSDVQGAADVSYVLNVFKGNYF